MWKTWLGGCLGRGAESGFTGFGDVTGWRPGCVDGLGNRWTDVLKVLDRTDILRYCG